MDAKLVVVLAGIILMIAIIGSLIFLRGYSGRFTFDTKNGTRPRASEGEGNTPAVTMKGRFQILDCGRFRHFRRRGSKALVDADGLLRAL